VPSLAERLNGKLYRLFIALILVYAVLTSFGPMMNQVDLGWQVAQGRWIVQHARPYSHDLFNYPNLGHPVINEYPLFEIVLYTAWSLGWWGPCLLTATAYAALIAVVVLGARRVGLPESAFVAVAIGVMFLFFQVAFPLRPHLVTFLGVIILGTFLLAHRDTMDWKCFWPVALAQIAWTNCHSGFVIGPAMVGLFGAEVTFRRWARDKSFPWQTARTWLGVFLLILLACLVNPYGWARFYPPFFQDRLESIRAYVGEMEPLNGGAATLVTDLTALSVIVGALIVILNRGAISLAFLLIAFLLFEQAQEIMKAWPVFGLFLPLVVLSSSAFTTRPQKPVRLAGVLTLFVATSIAALAVIGRVDPAWDSSIASQWREFDHGRTEMATEATAWMKAHHLNGRIFQRCEDGGWLQQEGYVDGQTFADTGFGKYDEAFIHEVGLVNERPALIPKYLAAYKPDFVVCGNLCYQWPVYLNQSGWILIYYSPNSSVWERPDARPEPQMFSGEEIERRFDSDLKSNGLPASQLLGRDIIALNSLLRPDFAFAKLTGLPPEIHHVPWYWEAARILCFDNPPFNDQQRDSLVQEAESLHDETLTAEFRAYGRYASGDVEAAFQILAAVPAQKLSNGEAELLLKIELGRKMPKALALARRTDCWNLRNGKHWQYLAEAEEKWGHPAAARTAWKKAIFYYPDDTALMQAASEFAAKNNDVGLAKAIANSGKIYGVP
jgi:hypothetical protein